jgi:hypothetical protein
MDVQILKPSPIKRKRNRNKMSIMGASEEGGGNNSPLTETDLPSYAGSHGLLKPWMNAERVPFEALKERSRVCFGGFRLPVRSPASRSLAEGRRFGEGRPL